MPKKGYKQSEEHKRKNSDFHKGRKHTEDSKKKISEALKGRKFSKETRKKKSEAAKKRTGSNSPHWKGGISLENNPRELTLKLKQTICRRDNLTCQICGKINKGKKRKLDTHHIDGNRKNNHPDNLITLCRFCHSPRGSHNKIKFKLKG